MNADQLKKNVGDIFRLRPHPIRMDADGRRLPPRDDGWRLDAVLDAPKRIAIRNISTHHAVELESDNVQERRSPDFLLLRCQLILRPDGLDVEPIHRGAAIGVANATDRWVSLEYVEKAGIVARLRAEGYTPRWIRADQEAQRVDLEGWEYVEDIAADGALVRFKVRDPICHYLVLVRRHEA